MKQLAIKHPGWHARLSGLFDRLGPCGNIGLLIGIIAGGLLSLLSITADPMIPSPFEVFWIFVILSVFCWWVLVFLSVVFLRLQLRPVLFGMLVRSSVISLFIVLITHLLGAYRFGILIGVFIGLFFGYVLCVKLDRVRG